MPPATMGPATSSVRSDRWSRVTWTLRHDALYRRHPMNTMAPFPSTPRRILLVEDHDLVRDTTAQVLRCDGHEVTCASDGIAALELLTVDAAGFDLILTDHHMPHLTGLELVSCLRGGGYSGQVIVFSAEQDPEILGAYRALRVHGFLSKPVDFDQLRAALQSLFAGAPAAPSVDSRWAASMRRARRSA